MIALGKMIGKDKLDACFKHAHPTILDMTDITEIQTPLSGGRAAVPPVYKTGVSRLPSHKPK
jgi:hypothetical protein